MSHVLPSSVASSAVPLPATQTSVTSLTAEVATPQPTLRERMTRDLQLRGLSERTQEAYLRAVRQLAAFYRRPPDQPKRKNCAVTSCTSSTARPTR